MKNRLLDIYGRIYKHFGPQGWWPAGSAFEVVVGAILTQNTSWMNVERAIANLKKGHFLTFQKMRRIDEKKNSPPDKAGRLLQYQSKAP
ncbi:MAG: hypothetical protein V1840_01760 [Candidatus Omnitrophota bacterium]